MEQKTQKLYPSAPVEEFDLEQRLEKNYLFLTVLITLLTTLKN